MPAKMTIACITLYQIKDVPTGIVTHKVECLRGNREVKGRDVDLVPRSMLMYNHHGQSNTYSKNKCVESGCANIEWFCVSAKSELRRLKSVRGHKKSQQGDESVCCDSWNSTGRH